MYRSTQLSPVGFALILLFIAGCSPTASQQPQPVEKAPAVSSPQVTAPQVDAQPVAAAVQPAVDSPAAAPVTEAATPAPVPELQTTKAVETTAPIVPATIEEAARFLDLRTFPLPAAAVQPQRSLCSFSYNIPGKVTGAFQEIKQVLVAQKWQELPNGYSSDDMCSGTFSREGYKLSLSAIPLQGDQSGQVSIALANHGNVDTRRLPVPAGAKVMFHGPVSSMYETAASVEDTLAAMTKLLTNDHWLPYGTAGDVYDFKRNAVKLSVRILAAPTEAGKTFIDLSTILLAADIPLPPNAMGVQYSDTPTQLGFDLPGEQAAAVVAFYREQLAKQTWEATTENLVKIDWREFMIFRNLKKDLLEIQITKVKEITRVMVRYQTAEEVAAQEKAFAEEKKRKQELANQPKPKLSLTLPAECANVESTAQNIAFTVEAGRAKATLQNLRTQCLAAGWKVESAFAKEQFGKLSLTKDKSSLAIDYIETGILASEITIRATNLELELTKQ